MRYNVLGQTGLFVSEVCLGTMTFGHSQGRYAKAGGILQDEADAIFRRAFDAGINFVDTANVYTAGEAEEITGRALKNLGIRRDDVVIATKVEGAMGAGPNDAGASRFHIMAQVKASLKRLDVDHIDLYQVHAWDAATSVEEVVRALDDLVRQGHVRYIGVSTGRRGRSRALSASLTGFTRRGFMRCRRTTRSSAAISSARSCQRSPRKSSASSRGARSRAVT